MELHVQILSAYCLPHLVDFVARSFLSTCVLDKCKNEFYVLTLVVVIIIVHLTDSTNYI